MKTELALLLYSLYTPVQRIMRTQLQVMTSDSELRSIFLRHTHTRTHTHKWNTGPSFNMRDWSQWRWSGVAIKSILNEPYKLSQTNIFVPHKCYLVAHHSFCLLLHACLLCLFCVVQWPVVGLCAALEYTRYCAHWAFQWLTTLPLLNTLCWVQACLYNHTGVTSIQFK